MDAAVSTELVDFIRRECALSGATEISARTGMQCDLDVYGDDAMEFLAAYSDAFHVDISDFPSAHYFDGEGPDIVGFIIGFFGRTKAPRQELTVGHLQQGINARRLTEHVI